jgi:hypothetical protein
MKTVKLIIISALAAVLVSPLCAIEAKITSLSGKVEIGSGEKWAAAKEGDVLQPGDSISTGFKSEAVLSMGKSTIHVKPLSRMTVEQLYEQDGNEVSSVYLAAGRVKASARHQENRRVGFTVKTPAMVASVRGTDGIVGADGRLEGEAGKWCIMPPEVLNVSPKAPTQPFDFNYPSQPGTVYVTGTEKAEVSETGSVEKPSAAAAKDATVTIVSEKGDAAAAAAGSVQTAETGTVIVTVTIK